MHSYRAIIQVLSPFGTPLSGDTLFGQLCWQLCRQMDLPAFNALLDGYTAGQPFAICSDAFPHGHLPKPHLPPSYFKPPAGDADAAIKKRKRLKKQIWLPLDKVAKIPLSDWQNQCLTDEGIKLERVTELQSHNKIDRRSGTTNQLGFAPYNKPHTWYKQPVDPDQYIPAKLDLYFLIDKTRIAAERIQEALEFIGQIGYGRDASIGKGKFELIQFTAFELPKQEQANACLSLAPVAPQGLNYDGEQSFYQLITRFGRHGDVQARSRHPFKNPILMAQTGAVFKLKPPAQGFIGQGLSGLSKSLPTTVHQGYAPVLPIRLEMKHV